MGAADRCARPRVPIPSQFPPAEIGGGSECRLPGSSRPSEAQSPKPFPLFLATAAWETRGRASPTTRQNDGRGLEAGPPPHSPAERRAPRGRARDSSGSAPPSPAPRPGPPPSLRQRQDLKSPPRATAAGDANRPAVPSPRRRGRGRRDPGAGAQAQWTRPRPSPSAPEVCRDPNSKGREAAGPVKAPIGMWAGPREGWAGP